MDAPKGPARRRSILLLAVLTLLATGRARPVIGQAITEFLIPSGAQPVEITPGPGGMWFTESGHLGLIGLGGRISEFPVQVDPRSIVAGPDGNLWFTSQSSVSRMTTEGVVTRFISNPMHIGSSDGWPAFIVAGENGLLFTDADIEGGLICRVTVDGAISRRYILTANASDPARIARGPNGDTWFATLGKHGDAVIGHGGGWSRLFTLPGVQDVGGIVAGTDGNIWFTETNVHRVGRITDSGVITEFNVSGDPRGIAAGPDGNLWFTETESNMIGRISTAGELVEYSIPTQDAGPRGIAAGSDGNIWFTEANRSQIGKIWLVNANDLSLAGGRYHAAATWQSSTASGEAHPVSLTSETGYFWFSDPANVELVVKILDGCTINDRLWVFVAGLTNVNVILTVTDTWTLQSRTYTNPQGTAFLPIQDTGAFSTCP